jgi:hypothetical protein
MKYRYIVLYSLWISIWLAVPALVSAKGLPHSAKSWNAEDSFILKVQSTERWETDRPDLGGKGIYSYGSELSREPKLFRESREQSSEGDKDTRSYSEPLGSSFDIPDSVNGRSRSGGPWWDGRSSADPMVEDLSRMDSGLSGPGSPAGSLGR